MTKDLSVYQLTLNTLSPSQSLQVSSATLQSLVGVLIDVLIEEKIPATIWVKQPPENNWENELQRYQQSSIPQTIYLCSGIENELAAVTDVGNPVAISGNSQVVPLQLSASSQLQQECFLIVVSDQLSGLIVACQPESTILDRSQSQPLDAICTFERRVIQRVVAGMKGIFAIANPTPEELLGGLETQFSLLSTPDEKALLTQLLVKQIQRTEDKLHSLTTSEPEFFSQTTTAIPPSPHDDLRNKDELLKRVVQELRTPLTNMKTALKLLDSPQLKPAQRQRYTQLLNTECDRQISLMAGLQEIVQLESEPEPTTLPLVQLAAIVPGVVSTYQPLAQEKGIQLGYTVPRDLPCVLCLETWLRQIVINLLHNSLKFTPTGGQVQVRATLQGEYLQLGFSDTGIGIAPNEIPRIFDSFYRGRSTISDNTGAGLGLTIVQQLLLRCGGSISVTSRLGEGSNFKVLLPIATSTSAIS
jgi:signal transduction histidine kinase